MTRADDDVVQIHPDEAPWIHRLLTLVPACFVALAVVWPQAFGWSGKSPFALLIAMRGLAAIALGALAALFFLVGFARGRRTLWTLSIVALAAAAASGLILVTRGLTSDAVPPPAVSDGDADVRVLAFNALGVSSDRLADLVRDVDADIIVLSETTLETTERLASLLGGGFQVFHEQPGVATHSATGLLVSSRLGAHGAPIQSPTSPQGMFTVPPSVSPPVSPEGMAITAVHALRPRATATQTWRTDVQWAVDQCRQSRGAIVAGDFNATLDHEPMLDLGPCVDAADVRNASGVGTWPETSPSWAGTPIDHILVDARVWSVRSFSVLDDGLGSDHRPVVATLRAQ